MVVSGGFSEAGAAGCFLEGAGLEGSWVCARDVALKNGANTRAKKIETQANIRGNRFIIPS
jgi:hypothetical protein